MKFTHRITAGILLLCSVMMLASCGDTEPALETEEAVTETPAEPENENTEVPVSEPVSEEIPEPAEEENGPELLFEDNFDGSSLDTTKWELCPEWERQGGMSFWDNDMVSLNGEGHLVLRAEWDEAAGRVNAGAVRTEGLFSASYGYYEASIKFPYAPGVWGAFWMMCGNVGSEANGAVDGVEIDIIESIGNDWGASNSALHWDGYGNAHKNVGSGEFKYDIYDGEFHTFGLERTEDAYIFYVDGKQSWKVTSDKCDICPADGYLKLTLESAEWAGGGKPACIKALPVQMEVDYVRVYAEKPE
ncbi:MAG: glycoside hydrolase family 16 protein [Clostridia bacterium]|nr:glycoside hydrolase family 16 protein [Clostridia bacterium]